MSLLTAFGVLGAMLGVLFVRWCVLTWASEVEEGVGPRPHSRAPSREWVSRMADIEDETSPWNPCPERRHTES